MFMTAAKVLADCCCGLGEYSDMGRILLRYRRRQAANALLKE